MKLSPSAVRGLALTGATLAATLAAPAAVTAAPTNVDLRIEAGSSTIYEGPVTTDGKVVSPQGGPDQRCDGTNGGANASPGPVPTSALEDGEGPGGYSWAGDYFSGFEDYAITRIGFQSQNSSQFWGVFVNGVATQVGGCQQIVSSGDEVLWAFDAFSKERTLRLDGPVNATVGQSLTLRVTDGGDGAPLAGASVGGSQTGADGRAQVTYGQPGVYRLKAERPQAVRSNALVVCVDREGADPCSSADGVAPKVRFPALPRLASRDSTSRTFTVEWEGSDGTGSGIAAYDLDVRLRGTQGWRPVVRRTQLTEAQFGGQFRQGYEFRVTAIDRAGNRDTAIGGPVSVPIDDRARKLIRFERGWKRLERKGAWGGFVRRSTRRGRTVTASVEGGGRVALIGRKLRRGGKLRVIVDDQNRLIRLRGTPRFRDVLWVSEPLPRGRHILKLRSGRNPSEIDAVAVFP
jgi:hypothetical protein